MSIVSKIDREILLPGDDVPKSVELFKEKIFFAYETKESCEMDII